MGYVNEVKKRVQAWIGLVKDSERVWDTCGSKGQRKCLQKRSKSSFVGWFGHEQRRDSE